MMMGSFWLCWLLLPPSLLRGPLVTAESSPSPISSVSHDLTYDENQKLKTHTFLHTAACTDIPTRRHFESYPVAGEALQTLFGSDDTSCQAVCIEKGTDRTVAHAVMPHKIYPGDGDLVSWFERVCARVEVCLVNYHNKVSPLQLYWVTPDGAKKHHLDIAYGESKTRCFASFIGHRFMAIDQDTDQVVGDFLVEFNTIMAFGDAPPSDNADRRSFEDEIVSTLNYEWERHNRIKRTFSPLGFKKGRLPDDVFASMGAFYYNNRHHAVREEWGGRGVFVNWWETEVLVIQVPWDLKQLWQVRLRELVEAWAGVPVEQTVMYGLRQYTEGARLLTHVDRRPTHAVSLIVNIAQGNLTEPWPVEVQDHADRIHEVTMAPGDVVYYESAKCLHARNRPMTGPKAYYVNLFTHYRPIGDDNWFTKPNPPGTPEPVLDVEGGCRLVKKGLAEVPPDGRVGLIETVECDDKRLGPYISPTLFQASSGEDLIRWWRMTDPRNAVEAEGDEEVIDSNDEL